MYCFCSCCYVRVRGYSFNSFTGLKCDDTLLWWCRWDTSRCAPWFRPRLRRTSWLTIGHWANFRSRRNSFSLRILTRFCGLIDFPSPEALQLCKCRLSTLSKWLSDLKYKSRQVPHQNKFFRLTTGEVTRKLSASLMQLDSRPAITTNGILFVLLVLFQNRGWRPPDRDTIQLADHWSELLRVLTHISRAVRRCKFVCFHFANLNIFAFSRRTSCHRTLSARRARTRRCTSSSSKRASRGVTTRIGKWYWRRSKTFWEPR